jgi:5S rRNA maturation endonuclease (ribonuclease M5)
MDSSLKGFFTITVTPFTEDSSVDVKSVKTFTEHQINKGVHGMTILGIMGEVGKLTETERNAVMIATMEQNGGRVPIVVGCSASSTIIATQYAKQAEAAGAAADMIAPPQKISNETLDYCDVQQDNHNNIVFHYYDSNDVLMTVKYRPARKLQDHEAKTWCQKNADFTPLLFNMNKIDPTHPLLICEGEIDALSAIEAGFKNTVSVPIGAGNDTWIEENFEWLEQFEKIIIWSDNDAPGLKMRKNIIPRLGEWKCFVVDLPTELEKDGKQIKVKDINEVLYHFGKEKVLFY